MEKKRTGIVGFGAIGASLLAAWRDTQDPPFNPVALLVKTAHAQAARQWAPDAIAVCTTLTEFLSHQPALVVEAAGHGAVQAFGPAVLAHGADLMVVSCGALADRALAQRLRLSSTQGRSRVLVPTGAIAGLDGLRAMRCLGLQRVKYTSTKPPAAWLGTLAETRCNLGALDQPTTVFQGSAGDAARLFPKNANLAAAVALAGLGFEATEVALVADPGTPFNTARIHAEAHGTVMDLTLQNTPAPGNQKTSVITGMSVVAAIGNQTGLLQFM